MIVHLVLFTPRDGLTDQDRDRVVGALDRALTTIPSIRRYQVGRRIRLGTAYDSLAPGPPEYCGMFEFATREDLKAYLDHPAHAELGQLFYQTSSSAQAFDFETVDADAGARLAAWQSK